MILPTELPDCRLRPWKPEDKEDLVRHANNRSVWRNLTHRFPHPYTEADAEFWIGYASEQSPAVHFAIEFQGAAVGGIGIIGGEGIFERTGQFGYWLGEPFWGQGIATAAARALVAYSRANLSFARLEGAVFEWNPASMRVLEKAGFIRESVIRQSVFKDGQLLDCVMYALVEGDPAV